MKKCMRVLAVFLSVILSMAGFMLIPPKEAYAAGVTYYVSNSDPNANDNNAGTSSSAPWKSLTKVSNTVFNAGDTICLKKGDTWSGQELILKGNGTLTNMITLTTYGTGNRPVITNPSSDSDADLSPNISPDPRSSIKVAIKLKNYINWKIIGIEISSAEYGIIAYNVTQTHFAQIWIEDCYIHDISGGRLFSSTDNPQPILMKSDGIFIYRFSPTVKSCNIQRTVRAMGFLIATNILVDGCYIYDSYTEGVSVVSAMRGTISNCQIIKTGYPSGVFHGIAAVLFGSCNDITIQDSTIADVYDPSIDGVGIDFEGCNTNVTAIRNNIYDCDSAAFLVYNTGTAGNDNSVSRIIDNRIDNCGRRDAATLPAFIRHYANTNNNGVIIGNNIRKRTASQAVNYISVASPSLTDVYPATYNVFNNTVYAPGQNFPAAPSASPNSWTASSSFSSTNGSSQWYYQEWNGSGYSDMTWDSVNNRWKGSLTNVLVGSNWQHPENGRDSVRKWIAPKAGTISISGTAKKAAAGGDGVAVYIVKNGTTIFGPTAIEGNNTTGISTNVSSVNVDAGDDICFIVNKRTTIDSDATIWDPTITMATRNSWGASEGFTNGQGRNQWYYDFNNTSTPGVYNAMSWDSANSRWKGTATYLITGSNYQHPENGYNSVRKWIAPRDGSITITGTARLNATGGDGVKVKIVKNGKLHFSVDFFPEEVVFAEQTVTTTTGISTNAATTVKAGDIIHFIVNRNSTITNDSTTWDPVITYN